jgi:dienelactone hydrolase
LNKFNIELLTERLDAVTQWARNNNDTKKLSIGYFGASTGAAAALYAAASFCDVKGVVSSGTSIFGFDRTLFGKPKDKK